MGSKPLQPRSTACRTSGSHGSPAATVITAPEQAAVSSAMPWVAILTTVPSKPASPTSRFEPPPSTSSGSPLASKSVTASTNSASVLTVIIRRAGPPTRSVVWSAKTTPAACSVRLTSALMITMRNPHTKINFDSPRAQHALPITDRFDADRHQ